MVEGVFDSDSEEEEEDYEDGLEMGTWENNGNVKVKLDFEPDNDDEEDEEDAITELERKLGANGLIDI